MIILQSYRDETIAGSRRGEHESEARRRLENRLCVFAMLACSEMKIEREKRGER
jgi:hypothetical protein